MRIYDISLPISPTLPVWPGDSPIQLEQTESMDAGAHYNISHFSASAHVGTHVDAPHHFLNDHRAVESLPLDVLTGSCYVAQLPDDMNEIDVETLNGVSLPEGTTRLLFGTRNSHLWAKGETTFQTDYVAVTEDGARWLVERGIQLVGVDYLSVAPFNESEPTHRVLLEAGVVVIEGLNLSQVPRGFYELYCLPLKLVGSDGAPARAILISK
ncbi:MAG TPA: cyclase family protein [Anaerolineales bacterium]|nr:cyclase family protein [Anaerolineales bacterium]